MGASVVTDKGLEASPSGKVTETKNEKIWNELECIEHLQIGYNKSASPNINTSVNNASPHGSLPQAV